MKTITRKTMIFVLTALFTLLVNGCDNLYFDGDAAGGSGREAEAGIPAGFGAARFSLLQDVKDGAQGGGLVPTVVLANLYWDYLFEKDGLPAEPAGQDGDRYILRPGHYHLTVKAYADADKKEQVAEAEADFTVTDGAETAVDIILRPIAEGAGTGTLGFSLTYPEGAAVETFMLVPVFDAEPIDLTKVTGATSGGNPVTWSGTKDGIPVGYYIVQLVLKDGDGGITGRVALAHIYQNLKAEVDYTFIPEDFKSFKVTSGGDSGPGTLRYAITNAPDGQPIQIEGVSEITLASPIGIRGDRTLLIEGNGVTITRGSSWSNNPLISVNGSNIDLT